MRTIEKVVDDIEDIEMDDRNFDRSMAVARRLDEILEIHRAEKSDYDKMQKISLDLAFENYELRNKSKWIPVSERLPEMGISRAYIEPIIEELENICVNGDEHILNLLADIKNAPSVTPQPNKWIPVTERLPEEEHEVYCQLSDGSNAVLYVQDNWGQMEWVDGMMGTGTYDVVAWREKPEPYKAENPETCKGCLEPCIMYEPDMRGCKNKVTERGEQ